MNPLWVGLLVVSVSATTAIGQHQDWWVQDPGVTDVRLLALEILAPPVYAEVRETIVETLAPCDELNPLNGLDGRWLRVPFDDQGRRFVLFEAWGGISTGPLDTEVAAFVAFYDDRSGACRYMRPAATNPAYDILPTFPWPPRVPDFATHAFVTGHLMPGMTDEVAGAVHPRLDVRFCTSTDAAERATMDRCKATNNWVAWNHPRPSVRDLAG